MFELFTDAARAAVVLASEAARELQHDRSTEHIPLGLLRRPDGLGAQILAAQSETCRRFARPSWTRSQTRGPRRCVAMRCAAASGEIRRPATETTPNDTDT
jgi:hypothetical protein